MIVTPVKELERNMSLFGKGLLTGSLPCDLTEEKLVPTEVVGLWTESSVAGSLVEDGNWCNCQDLKSL